MGWPLSQDYNEAIQNPAANLAEPELRTGEALKNAWGIPTPCAGNFADVYQIRCPNGTRWAVKLFTRERDAMELRDRYVEISRQLEKVKLPFMVDFNYVEPGIRVKGKWYPLVKMQWVEGLTLNQFVDRYVDQPAVLKSLLWVWGRMAVQLRSANVGHCDLQHGNVLLVMTPESGSVELKLIDYDGIWVPTLADKTPGEVGHASYQHPQRIREGTYHLDVDRFSVLLIATAVQALAVEGGSLWKKYPSEDNLLFTQADLLSPTRSHLFHHLLRKDADPMTKAMTKRLFEAIRSGLETVPLLEDVIAASLPGKAPLTPGGPVPLPPLPPVRTDEKPSVGKSVPSEPGRPTQDVPPPPPPRKGVLRELFWALVLVIGLLCAVTLALTYSEVFPNGLFPPPEPSKAEYQVKICPSSVVSTLRDRDGKRGRYVSFQFQIKRWQDNTLAVPLPEDEILVEEDGVMVAALDLQPNAQKLTLVLLVDVSGSMARSIKEEVDVPKMDAVKKAAQAFLRKLDRRADVGLILFDHEIQAAEPPVRDPAKQEAHRERLREIIQDAKPMGGTAHLDATVKAVDMLRGIPGRRAVVLMTDGADTNSKTTLPQAITAAQHAELPVYTLGIGEPGKNDPVTTVLVLDRSGSMIGKADDKDNEKKIDALKRAATRFVELMRYNAKTTLLPFSDKIDAPEPFTNDRAVLRARIQALKPFGGTLLYDATFAGIETLVAGDVKGKRAVVVLTDGKDEAPGSRYSDERVIERAKEVKIPLYMLGLGKHDEINEPVMRKMARETGGEYYHAGTQKKLLELFETLSVKLHHDGVDEESLKKLARETGGRYTHVGKTSELSFLEKLADELQTTYQVTFASRPASHDGTARGIEVKIVRDKEVISKMEKEGSSPHLRAESAQHKP